jgi:hypothetical protein
MTIWIRALAGLAMVLAGAVAAAGTYAEIRRVPGQS